MWGSAVVSYSTSPATWGNMPKLHLQNLATKWMNSAVEPYQTLCIITKPHFTGTTTCSASSPDRRGSTPRSARPSSTLTSKSDSKLDIQGDPWGWKLLLLTSNWNLRLSLRSLKCDGTFVIMSTEASIQPAVQRFSDKTLILSHCFLWLLGWIILASKTVFDCNASVIGKWHDFELKPRAIEKLTAPSLHWFRTR